MLARRKHVDPDGWPPATQNFTNYGSQFGDDRPLSSVSFAPDGAMVATGSWKGSVKLWSIPNFEPVRTWHGHGARVGSVSFHPQSRLGLSPSAANVVSCAADGSISLWSLERFALALVLAIS